MRYLHSYYIADIFLEAEIPEKGDRQGNKLVKTAVSGGGSTATVHKWT